LLAMSATQPFSTGFTPLPPDGPRPDWLKIRVRCGGEIPATRARLQSLGLNTVCASAACPNICHCWSRGHATILILGPECTRHCRFCNVSKGAPVPPDPEEPRRVAEAVRDSGLGEVVVTSVTRDDLPDGGAAHWADTVSAIRAAAPGVRIEVLTPDFQDDANALKTVFATLPDIFGHNLETVPRLYRAVRPEADYARSLAVLRAAAAAGLTVKTSLMLGLGETDDEIFRTLADARAAGASIVFMGQYLRPSPRHVPVAGYLSPEHFAALGEAAKRFGFAAVESAPFVRSSYRGGS
jgi:lipoic acid synthetase